MADERIYVIPLRKKWVKTTRVHRAPRSINVIREFICKHMRVEDVHVSPSVNDTIWAHGAKKPPGKIKVKATKDGNAVRVTLPDEKPVVKKEPVKSKSVIDKIKEMPAIRAETKAKPAEAETPAGKAPAEEKPTEKAAIGSGKVNKKESKK